MRTFSVAAGLLVFCFCKLALSADVSSINPVSGVISYSNYTVIFAGANTRSEMRYKDEVEMIALAGESWWLAYPASGRIITQPESAPQSMSYPEQVRRTFLWRTATNATRLGSETIRDWPCWKYSVKIPSRMNTSQLVESTLFFLANTNFPHLVTPELITIDFDCPVDQGVFAKPANLKIARNFHPRGPFAMELTEFRESKLHGWKTISTNTLTCDGDKVMRCFTQYSIDPNKTNYFGPRYETNAMPVGLSFLNHPAGAPFWNAVRKIGTATLLSLPAEIYVNPRGPGEDIYWVVDHPEAGTFSARHVLVGDGMVETNEVTRFEITN